MIKQVSTELGGRELVIETGKLAKQASGSVTVRYGDSLVLVTAAVKMEASAYQGFLPLSVDYAEKMFAAGKIPGGFFKREGRAGELATLTARFIDRPIRPLFPDGYCNETQVIATVLSADDDNDTDLMAMIGASAALSLSCAPFMGPIAGVRVAKINGELVINPNAAQSKEAVLDVIVAGSKDAVVMVEGGANECSEEELIEAINFAHEKMQPVIAIQEELAKACGKEKMEVKAPEKDEALEKKVVDWLGNKLLAAATIREKMERYAALSALKDELVAALVGEEDDAELKSKVGNIYSELKKKCVRNMILDQGTRIDGRDLKTVRPIATETGFLARSHGSALFTRGETQALVAVTLGTKEDQQIIDDLKGSYYKRFMLHYNFPPYSVGEVKFMRGPGRREIGHGALAERSLRAVLPPAEEFNYTIRVVSEVLESNGSSSMASVCGGSMALMDAGVPLRAPVAGVAMGLIQEGDKTAVLTDILGDEDHLGDMDFKVAGTKKGVTAIQMDIKIEGLSKELLRTALHQANDARMHILGEMEKTISSAKEELSAYAPKMETIKISTDMIGTLIGPSGKNIKKIAELTGAKVDIEDDGTVSVSHMERANLNEAMKMVRRSTATVKEGRYYKGKVVRIAEFGAFVELIPGTDGLLHVSEIAPERVNKVEDFLKEGDQVLVKVIEVDKAKGRIKLSRKQALDYDGAVEESYA